MKTTIQHPTTMKTYIYLLLFLALVLGLNIGCDTNSLTGPEGTNGALMITTATSGPDQDADGYLITIDGAISGFAAGNDSFIQDSIREGTYDIELTEVAGNCTVDSDNPQPITITAGETASVSFNISCIEAFINQIVLVSDRDGAYELYLMNPDGSGQTRLTNNSILEQDPAISPDGTRIAFSALDSQDNTYKIWVMNADGTNPVQLTTGNDVYPHWSPDGTQLSFSRRSQSLSNNAIYLMDADGANQTILVNTPWRAGGASWSPDGQRVVFVSTADVDGDTEAIYSMNIDGTGLQVHLYGGYISSFNPVYHSYTPVYSPDGTKIAFIRDADDYSKEDISHELNILNADGTGTVQRVTGTPAMDGYSLSDPSWSPDGSRLVFASRQGLGSDHDIYVINTDGTSLVNLTANGAYDGSPHWSPVE